MADLNDLARELWPDTKEQIVKALGDVPSVEVPATVVQASANGVAIVDFGGETTSGDDSQFVEIQTDAHLEEGDEVFVTIKDGTPIGVTAGGWGDRMNGEITAFKAVYADYVEAQAAVIGDLQADTAKVHDLTAEQLSAATAYVGALSAGNVSAQNIIADHGTVGSLSTNYAHLTNGVIDNATIGQANVNDLAANYAKLDATNINTATIRTAWVDQVMVQTGLLAQSGTVYSLDAIQVNASKITAGTIDVERLIVTVNNEKYLVHIDTSGSTPTTTYEKLDGNVIQDNTITADKIVANSITTSQITTQNLVGTGGWINLASGTFEYVNATSGDGISWDGTNLTISCASLTTAVSNSSTALSKATAVETRADNGEFQSQILGVTTAPSSYTTTTGGFTPKYRISLSTVKSQSGASAVHVGDIVSYSYYHYPVGYVDSSYVYCGTRKNLRGAAGADGTGVTVTSVEYGTSSSASTEPSSWSTTEPSSVAQGSWLWVKTTYSDSTTATTKSYVGTNGTPVTITSKEVKYQASSSGTTTPTGTWQTSVPTVAQGEYLWTRTVVNYSTGDSTTSYSVGRMGSDGSAGSSVAVSSVEYAYQLSTSGTTVPTGTWETTPQAPTTTQYAWTRTTVTYSDNSTSVTYTVGGKTGAKGDTGDTAQWYYGTALTHTSGTATLATSATPDVVVGAMYLNTESSLCYKCTAITNGTTATWTWAGDLTTGVIENITPLFDTIASDTGTTVITTPAATAPLVSLDVDGKSVQDGTPTPSAPVAIQSVAGAQLLANPENASGWQPQGGSTVEDYTDETVGACLKFMQAGSGSSYRLQTQSSNFVHVSGTTYALGFWARASAATTIYASCGTSVNVNVNYVNGESVGTEWTYFSGDGTANGAYRLTLWAGTAVTLYIWHPMLVFGTNVAKYMTKGNIGIATSWNGTTTPIDLQGHELRSLPNGTKDELQVDSSGTVTLIQRVGAYTVTGNETVGDAAQLGSYHRIRLSWVLLDNAKSIDNANSGWCTKAPFAVGYGAQSTHVYTHGAHVYAFAEATTDAAVLTAYTGATLLYPLATPQTISLGTIDMPTLADGDTLEIVGSSVVPTIGASWLTETGGKAADAAAVSESFIQLESRVTQTESDVTALFTATGEQATMVRAYGQGVLVCKTGNTVGALVNANGTFDVVPVTWSGDTPTVGSGALASFKGSTSGYHTYADMIVGGNDNTRVRLDTNSSTDDAAATLMNTAQNTFSLYRYDSQSMSHGSSGYYNEAKLTTDLLEVNAGEGAFFTDPYDSTDFVQVGKPTVVSGSSSKAISTAGIDTLTTGPSVALDPGVWLITAQWTFNTGSSSGSRNNQVAIGTSSSDLVAQERVYASSNAYAVLSTCAIVSHAATTTYYIYGSSSMKYSSATTQYIKAVRLN